MIEFAKAHACGNDFLVIEEDEAAGLDKAALAERLCARNTGVGADGVEFFRWTGPRSGRIRLHNADGSVAEISGNGTRCVAAWMAEQSEASAGDELRIETDAGERVCVLESVQETDDGPTWMVTTDMDVPEFETASVELADGTVVEGVVVSMGNPHFVIFTGHERGAPAELLAGERSWQEIGEEICFHADFPEQTNVEFVQVTSDAGAPVTKVGLLIFERGVGPTSSSGTGTSAAATAMIGVHGAANELEVFAPGGMQTVRWAGEGEPLYLTGPATLVCRGEAW